MYLARTYNQFFIKLFYIEESTLTARMTGRLPWKGDEIAAVAKVLGIPTDQIGTFFFEDAPKGGKGAA